AGMALKPEGILSGTAARLERAEFSVELSDAQKRSARQDLMLEIRPSGASSEQLKTQLKVTSTEVALPDVMLQEPVKYRFAAEDGTPPYRWTATGLPEGVTLSSNGDLAGAASKSGPHQFQVTVADAAGQNAKMKAHIVVKEAPVPLWRRALDVVWWLIFG